MTRKQKTRELIKLTTPYFDAGMSYQSIAERLNKDSVPTVNGFAWTGTNVAHFFRGKTQRMKTYTHKARVLANFQMAARAEPVKAKHDEVLDIMTSNMSDALKVKVIKAILI